MAGLPRILDVGDDLRRADEATEDDAGEDIERVCGLLTDYAGDDPADAPTLDEADEVLLRLEERTDSDVATERFQAARNRIRILRESFSGDGNDLAVIDTDRTGDGVESTVVNTADTPRPGR